MIFFVIESAVVAQRFAKFPGLFPEWATKKI